MTSQLTNPLNAVRKFFTSGAAETEDLFLKDAFVYSGNIGPLLEAIPHNPTILVGKKGTGKTAIIRYSSRILTEAQVRNIVLTPRDFPEFRFDNDASVGEIARRLRTIIVKAIGATIGSQLHGLLTGADAQLYKLAADEQVRSKDLIGQLADLLTGLCKPFTGMDPPSEKKAEYQGEQSVHLLHAIKDNINRTNGGFFVFFDDTDQIAALDKPAHLNRIWAFLLACRDITSRIEQLRCIVTLREEVWNRLTNDPSAQRDQTDHFIGLIRLLSPEDNDIKNIVARRLMLASNVKGERSVVNPYEIFFSPYPLEDGEESYDNWPLEIIRHCRGRPRDAIQLIRSCAEVAISSENVYISSYHFKQVIPEFSHQRVSLMTQELAAECPELDAVIRSFSDVSKALEHSSLARWNFIYTSQNLREHFVKLPSFFGVTLYGIRMQPGNEVQAFELWRLLFVAGVLEAVSSELGPDGQNRMRRIDPRREPRLVSLSRWRDLEGVFWQLNAAYHDFVRHVSASEIRRTAGGSDKRKSRYR